MMMDQTYVHPQQATPLLRGMDIPRFDESGVLTPKECTLSKNSSWTATSPPVLDGHSCSNSTCVLTPPSTPSPPPLDKPPFFHAQLNGRVKFVPISSLAVDPNYSTSSRVNIEFDLDRVRVFVGQVGHSVTAAMLAALFQRLLGELFKPLSCTCGSGNELKSRGCAYLIVKASDAPKLLTLHHRIYCDYGGFWVATTDVEASLLASTIKSGYSPRDVPRNLMVIELSQTYSTPPPVPVPRTNTAVVAAPTTYCVSMAPQQVAAIPTSSVASMVTPVTFSTYVPVTHNSPMNKVYCPRAGMCGQLLQWHLTPADAVCALCRAHLGGHGGFGCPCCALDLCFNCHNLRTPIPQLYATQPPYVQYQPVNLVPKSLSTSVGPAWSVAPSSLGSLPGW